MRSSQTRLFGHKHLALFCATVIVGLWVTVSSRVSAAPIPPQEQQQDEDLVSRADPHTHTLIIDLLADDHLGAARAVAEFAAREEARCATDRFAWFALSPRERSNQYAGCRECQGILAEHADEDSPYAFPPELKALPEAQELTGFCSRMLKLPCCQVDEEWLEQIGFRFHTHDEEVADEQEEGSGATALLEEQGNWLTRGVRRARNKLRSLTTQKEAEDPEQEREEEEEEQKLGQVTEEDVAHVPLKADALGVLDPKVSLEEVKVAAEKVHKNHIEAALRMQEEDEIGADTSYPYLGHSKCDWHVNDEEPLPGMADIHIHMFSDLAFGGVAIYGKANGTISEALKPCSGTWDHSMGLGNLYPHDKRMDGYPTFRGWPRWESVAHQQCHVDWLKKAATREGPDRLTVVHIQPAHNYLLCLLAQSLGRIPRRFVREWEEAGYKRSQICDNVDNIDRQMRAVQEMAEREKSWMTLALSPQQCRQAVRHGKLCVISNGGEAGCPCRKDETAEACVDRVWERGARSFQMIHLRNNRFSGGGFHTEMVDRAYTTIRAFIDTMQKKEKHLLSYFTKLPRALYKSGKRLFKYKYPYIREDFITNPDFPAKTIKHNPLGLTEDGKRLMRALIKKGMMVDMAHTSRNAQRDMFLIAKEHNYYPLFRSHDYATFFHHNGGEHNEYVSGVEALAIIAKTGGIWGMRPEPFIVSAYAKSRVPNACWGGSTSSAQVAQFIARELAVPLATAADLNGAATNAMPRFHADDPENLFEYEACGAVSLHCVRAGPTTLDFVFQKTSGQRKKVEEGAKQHYCPKAKEVTKIMQRIQMETPMLNKRVGGWLDNKGMGSVDAIPEIVQDWRNMGMNVDCPVCVGRSAENFVRVWERSLAADRPVLQPVLQFDDDFKFSGETETHLHKVLRTITYHDRPIPEEILTDFSTDAYHKEHADTSLCKKPSDSAGAGTGTEAEAGQNAEDVGEAQEQKEELTEKVVEIMQKTE